MNEILDDHLHLNEEQPNHTSNLILFSRIVIIANLGFNLLVFIFNLITFFPTLTDSTHSRNDLNIMFLLGGLISFAINLFVIIYNSRRLKFEWKQIQETKTYIVPMVLFIIYSIFQTFLISFNLIKFLPNFSFSFPFIRLIILLVCLIVVLKKEIKYYIER